MPSTGAVSGGATNRPIGWQGSVRTQPREQYNPVTGRMDPTPEAAAGYVWDPVQQGYQKTAATSGREAGQTEAARLQALSPAISSLMGQTNGGGASPNFQFSEGPSSSPAAGDARPSGWQGGPANDSPAMSSLMNQSVGKVNAPQFDREYTYETIDQPQAVHVNAPDTSAAQAALFAREKDRTAEVGRSALSSLRSALASRGALGGGAESRGTSRVVSSAASNLADVGREQTIQEAARQNAWAKTQYEGDIAQRGQDVTQRGQTIAENEARANRAQDWGRMTYEGDLRQRDQDITQRGQSMTFADAAAGRAQSGREAAAGRSEAAAGRNAAAAEAAAGRRFEGSRMNFLAAQDAARQRSAAMQGLLSKLY